MIEIAFRRCHARRVIAMSFCPGAAGNTEQKGQRQEAKCDPRHDQSPFPERANRPAGLAGRGFHQSAVMPDIQRNRRQVSHWVVLEAHQHPGQDWRPAVLAGLVLPRQPAHQRLDWRESTFQVPAWVCLLAAYRARS